ncbi:phage portal protein, partial [Streptomyces sp. NPDC088341]|uniref:phage portal protein n=1 Tax=Streptomyces sp. NPDC088341 TaxID=3154870 RepID=UPI00344705A5
MPLPAVNLEWPPPSTKEPRKLYDRWQAWYSGDPEQLARVHADVPGLGGDSDIPRGQPGVGARFVNALLQGRPRAFWGTPVTPGQVRSHKLHVPLAGDIASTSADVLYGEPPTFEVPDAKTTGKATQDRLDDIAEEANLAAVLLESGETGSAYGGSYLRVSWDPVLADCPLWDVIPPDCAVPEWRGGRLHAVTLWRDLESPDGRHWRHLERHEQGRVLHGLYASADEGKLGRRLKLVDHDATAPFALIVDPEDGQTVTTGASGLACEYVPNMRPNRLLRGSALGRSDYAGIEPMLDSLDEAWTSWLRDLRLGKGRLVVPRAYTMSRGRGRGTTFDPEREVFEAVDAIDNGDGPLKMSVVQFAIRVEEHSRTCREITAEAVRGAGYSAQTFGQNDEVAATATEVNARQGRTASTRGKKQLYARGPLARLARATLEIDAAKFGRKPGVNPELRPAVRWQDGVPFDIKATART